MIRLANFLLAFIVALVLIPVLAVFLSWLNINTDLWAHFLNTRLLDLLMNTGLLLLGVSSISLLLGVGMAWLISHYEFPGR